MLILKEEDLVQSASYLARRHHKGMFRRDGVTPYITHVEDVVRRVIARHGSNPVLEAIAWLHDMLEEFNAGGGRLFPQDLKDFGFPSRVTDAVVLLTLDETIPYRENIFKIKENYDSLNVKVCDNLSNLCDDPSDKQIIRYADSLTILLGGAKVHTKSWNPLYHEY